MFINFSTLFYYWKTYWNYHKQILEKREFLQHQRTHKGFKGTVVNQVLPSLQEGSLEIIS